MTVDAPRTVSATVPLARAGSAGGPGGIVPAQTSFAALLERLRRSPVPATLARDPEPEGTWKPFAVRWAAPEDEGGPHRLASLQLDRIAAIASVDPPRPRDLTLGVSSELGVRLSRTDEGVFLVIEAAPQRTANAEEQLPRVVRALQVHGVQVARASVRTVRRPGGAR